MAQSQMSTRVQVRRNSGGMPEFNGMLVILLAVMITVVIGLTVISWDNGAPFPQRTARSADAPSMNTVCQPRREWIGYTLPDHESLATLARQVGVSLAMLEAANCLNRSELHAGMIVYLPALPPAQSEPS